MSTSAINTRVHEYIYSDGISKSVHAQNVTVNLGRRLRQKLCATIKVERDSYSKLLQILVYIQGDRITDIGSKFVSRE